MTVQPLLLAFLIVLSPALYAKDVILVISLNDEQALRKDAAQDTIDYLQTQFPSARVELLSTKYGHRASRVKQDIHDQFSALQLTEEDHIRMLVLRTHGSSRSSSWANYTKLGKIGQINDSKADEQFIDFFSPMRPTMAKDLHVVLESCRTFCGSPEKSAVRARALLEGLGASEGSLYGATTYHMSENNNVIKTNLKSLGNGAFLGLIFFFLSVVHSDSMRDMSLSESLVALASSFTFGMSVGIFLEHGIMPPLQKGLSALKWINFGRIFKLRNGEIQEIKEVSFDKDRDLVMGGCQEILSGLSAAQVK